MTTTSTAIQTEGLTKYYGDFPALVDLDLKVQPGEVFGFLGPNGAGKTTTIRTLLDEIRPTAGRASILGLDCQADAVAIRDHLGYLPGDLAMYPNLTGRDTLTYFGNLRGGADWAFIEAMAERLDTDLTKKVGELSTGNRQKVGLIQAFMNRHWQHTPRHLRRRRRGRGGLPRKLPAHRGRQPRWLGGTLSIPLVLGARTPRQGDPLGLPHSHRRRHRRPRCGRQLALQPARPGPQLRTLELTQGGKRQCRSPDSCFEPRSRW